ncbi:MAG TPA: DNA polymerase Y family protein [Chloroflexota bacterium]|nr:DNA polymerase Y family protein [Chloroflexota bacterium]
MPQQWPAVRVACVWIAQLPLRVEVLRHPAWDGRPLVLGGAPGERKVVQLCSPEAEAAGVRPGLPLREVVPLCPHAIVVQPDPVRTAGVLESIVAALQHVSPLVEPGANDDGYLFVDLGGLRAMYEGDFGRLEADIEAAVPPLLRPRLGFGGGKFTAAVAARQAAVGQSRVVPSDQTTSFLAPLSVRHLLQLAPDVLERLELLGLQTIGDLAALPFGAVQAQFGPSGAQAWRLAHGKDSEPVVARPILTAVHSGLRFDDPLGSVEAVMAALDQLLAQTFSQPALLGRSVRQVRLRALLSDGTSWERLYTFKDALSTRDAARRALKSKLDLPSGLPPAPIDELALELLGLAGEAARQPGLFVARARQLAEIAEAARQLRARYGRVPLYQAIEVEPWSRIPERRWALIQVACDL